MAKILVVDDAAFMRARCSELLGECGYEVIEAASGAEALEVYRAQRPDGVLLDLTLPNVDGIVTLQKIMAMDPSARVVMVTTMGQQDKVANALNAGASDFVVKPFDSSRLLATVQKLVG